mmetsp:Transcript_25172/g.45896  ORF Transcript_25172/g.45896 Transcript_25172/m.45896 type:complete len:201 (-) Transcript_25172:1629-2231(-)
MSLRLRLHDAASPLALKRRRRDGVANAPSSSRPTMERRRLLGVVAAHTASSLPLLRRFNTNGLPRVQAVSEALPAAPSPATLHRLRWAVEAARAAADSVRSSCPGKEERLLGRCGVTAVDKGFSITSFCQPPKSFHRATILSLACGSLSFGASTFHVLQLWRKTGSRCLTSSPPCLQTTKAQGSMATRQFAETRLPITPK